MRKTALALILPAAMLLAAPVVFAQDEGLKKKSDAQLKEELDKLTEDISEGFGKVRDGLYEAALPSRKMDELREDFNNMMKKLKQGEADELHEGLKSFLEANPKKLEELLKLNAEEARELVENDQELLKKLSENADETAKLFRDANLLDDVLKRQAELEKNMESVKKAFKKGQKTEAQIEEVLKILQEAARRSKPQPGQGQPNEGEPQPGEQPGEEEQPGEDKPNGEKPGEETGDKPSGGAQDSGGDSRGHKPDGEDVTSDPSGNAFKAELKGKDAKKAANKSAERKPDPKYDGMKRAFRSELKKRLGK